MTGPKSSPWQTEAHALVLYCPEDEWRFAIYNDGGIIDGTLQGLPIDADPADAQAALLRRTSELSGRFYRAQWHQTEPGWWAADVVASQPQTREETAAHLDAVGVRPDTYDLFGAHLDDAIVMDQRPEGWLVFYCERGSELSIKVHDSEADACTDLLARLSTNEHAFFELVAGPGPAQTADDAFDEWLSARDLTRDDLDPADWKCDDVPWVEGQYWRRYFVRITTARSLTDSY